MLKEKKALFNSRILVLFNSIYCYISVRHYVPVAHPQVWEEAPTTARLQWHRAYIPRYYSNKPISYRYNTN